MRFITAVTIAAVMFPMPVDGVVGTRVAKPLMSCASRRRRAYLAFALTLLVAATSCVGEDEQRIVAFGDVHGDLEAARGALRLAGAIDEQDRWIGGDLIVVQTGDQLDRGDQEQAILDLFERLRIESEAAGGASHALLGNHELMNARGDLRYVTDGGFADFMDTVEYEPGDSLKVWDRSSGTFRSAILADFEPHQRARMAVLMPGGPYADLLAQRQVIAARGRRQHLCSRWCAS